MELLKNQNIIEIAGIGAYMGATSTYRSMPINISGTKVFYEVRENNANDSCFGAFKINKFIKSATLRIYATLSVFGNATLTVKANNYLPTVDQAAWNKNNSTNHAFTTTVNYVAVPVDISFTNLVKGNLNFIINSNTNNTFISNWEWIIL